MILLRVRSEIKKTTTFFCINKRHLFHGAKGDRSLFYTAVCHCHGHRQHCHHDYHHNHYYVIWTSSL